ncbi:hypothetical protein HY837_05455 [archaeon]|nr:hypothetical protein [archaeon]
MFEKIQYGWHRSQAEKYKSQARNGEFGSGSALNNVLAMYHALAALNVSGLIKTGRVSTVQDKIKLIEQTAEQQRDDLELTKLVLGVIEDLSQPQVKSAFETLIGKQEECLALLVKEQA